MPVNVSCSIYLVLGVQFSNSCSSPNFSPFECDAGCLLEFGMMSNNLHQLCDRLADHAFSGLRSHLFPFFLQIPLRRPSPRRQLSRPPRPPQATERGSQSTNVPFAVSGTTGMGESENCKFRHHQM